MRKYPIGEQDFGGIIKGGFVYVDKTRLIHTLIDSGKYYFLSRPRRFGKSLLLSTIEEIFKGNKELFKGLWIENNWNWERKHPVIHIGISSLDYQELGLKEALTREMDKIAGRFGWVLTSLTLKNKFTELIEKAATQESVVILIDEYDKPIIDYLDDPDKAETNRQVFKEFYSVLKDAGKYIRLLLITGVSRFSKVSIFSDLNNLNDITLHPRYATLTGITQAELESNFAEEITAQQQNNPDILRDLKTWYNGYSWHEGIDTVYNPFSLLSYMDAGVFQNYWFQTGTPGFLIKEVQNNPAFAFLEEELNVGNEALNDLFGKTKTGVGWEHMNPVTLMFQTGYLTIHSYNQQQREYILGYPNLEVKESVLIYLVSGYSGNELGRVRPTVNELGRAFTRNDIPRVIKIIDTLFSTIPNPLWIGARESFFHGLIHNTFQLLGINLESEAHSSNGRADIVVKTTTHIYVMEFKLDGDRHKQSPAPDETDESSTYQQKQGGHKRPLTSSPEGDRPPLIPAGAHTLTPEAKAIEQILQKGYLRPYQLDPRQKTVIGINFSSEKRRVEAYEIKEL
jgi:hypothetical protein